MKYICSECKNEQEQTQFCCMVCGSKETTKVPSRKDIIFAPFQFVFMILYIFIVGIVLRRNIK